MLKAQHVKEVNRYDFFIFYGYFWRRIFLVNIDNFLKKDKEGFL